MDINNYFLVFPVLLPIFAGVLLMFLKFGKREHMQLYILTILIVDLASIGWIALQPEDTLTLSPFFIAEGLHVFFHVDILSKIFSVLTAFVWLMVGIASFEYMAHEKNEQRFYCFYLVVGGVLSALAFSGNLLTMYVFYELMTLTSMPLVMHNLSHEAIMAGLKYLFYSVAGAFMVLFGFFLFNAEGRVLYFSPGGIINEANPPGIMLFAVFLMIVGFGTKAGMFPMHGWLPTAHPVAPAPASAVLSGVITKAGVLGIIRSVYYVAGPDMIKGTWVQYTWIILSVLTIFMGSMMAYKEKILKKRLAYSTVSQVSYILFGLSVMQPVAFVGALMHVIFHSLVKNTLFVSAGAIICKTGKTKVRQLVGIGKEMPVTMWCFTLVSLTLIGIPPTSAFVSIWYLISGALDSGILGLSWIGPIVLLISALLTAGYLLTISIKAFLPGEDYNYAKLVNHEPTWRMLMPMIVMTALAVILGIWPGGLMKMFADIAASVL